MIARYIKGYGHKYVMREDATLWRLDEDTNGYVEVAQNLGGSTAPRVRLYAHGTERRVFVHVLYKECFGEYPRGYLEDQEKREREGRGGGASLLLEDPETETIHMEDDYE